MKLVEGLVYVGLLVRNAKKCGIDVNTLVDGPLCMYVCSQTNGR